MDYSTAVRNEIQNVRHELRFLETLIAKQTSQHLDEIEIRAAALSLSTIYNGIEKTLLYVLRDRAQKLPQGKNWHAELLDLAAEKSVVSADLREELKSFLAFRHFIRHAYSFEINPAMIASILDRAPDVAERFSDAIVHIYSDKP